MLRWHICVMEWMESRRVWRDCCGFTGIVIADGRAC